MIKSKIKLDHCRRCRYACDGNKDHKCKTTVELRREALKVDMQNRKEEEVNCKGCGASLLEINKNKLISKELCYSCEVKEHFSNHII